MPSPYANERSGDSEMTTENLHDIEDIDDRLVAKKARIEKEKKELEEAIAACTYKTKKDKVASILNLYPKTRNSDVALTIKFWETYQSHIFTGNELDPIKLFELERLTTVARIRAKIQNEYGLFLADAEIRKRRRKLEENVKEIMVNDNPSRPVITIFADETGKTGEFLIIGSIWFVQGIDTCKLYMEIMDWRSKNNWSKEIHFTKLSKMDVERIKSFVDMLARNRDYLGFKFIAFRRIGSSRSIEESIIKLYNKLILKGIAHELHSGRISAPRMINLHVDKEDSLDAVALDDLKQQISNQLKTDYDGQITIDSIEAVDSKISDYVQIADLISGAINRKFNEIGNAGFKDELADYILEKLDIDTNGTVENDGDSSIIITL